MLAVDPEAEQDSELALAMLDARQSTSAAVR